MGYSVKRVDDNQSELVSLWRKMGASVWISSSQGNGAPDVVLGIKTLTGELVNVLVEIKDGSKPLSKQKLTKHEKQFHQDWKGQICVIRSIKEAIDLYKLIKRNSKYKNKYNTFFTCD